MTACAATGDSLTPRPEQGLFDRLETALRSVLPAGPCRVALAYSGGLDSTALLHVAARMAARWGWELHALHVHHGLSPRADQWLLHCQAQCAQQGVAFEAASVQLAAKPIEGVEAQARRLRYGALAELARRHGCTAVLLAHHLDDQAETFVLQALRGAGVSGLAAMPRALQRDGLHWLRPWLQVSRADLWAYVRHHGLSHVEDESNLDVRFARNSVRLSVLPAMTRAFPGAVMALAQATAHMQEAQACLDELAALDLPTVCVENGAAIDVVAWAALSPPRRSNALRVWLKRQLGVPAPRTLVQGLMQLRPGHHPQRWPTPGGCLAVYRDVLRVQDPPSSAAGALIAEPMPWAVAGPGRYRLPFADAALLVVSAHGVPGVPLAALQALTWRPRSGGEQFQQHPRGVPRSLKKAFQAAAVPAWQRGLPLLYSGEMLLYVPGLGMDARALRGDGEDRVRLEWCSAPALPKRLGSAG